MSGRRIQVVERDVDTRQSAALPDGSRLLADGDSIEEVLRKIAAMAGRDPEHVLADGAGAGAGGTRRREAHDGRG